MYTPVSRFCVFKASVTADSSGNPCNVGMCKFKTIHASMPQMKITTPPSTPPMMMRFMLLALGVAELMCGDGKIAG
jgi:hypothetical protein